MTRPHGIGQPVFQPQSGHMHELPFVIRDESGAEGAGTAGSVRVGTPTSVLLSTRQWLT